MSKRPHDNDDEDEDDYMSDKILTAAAQAAAPQFLNYRNRRLNPPPPPPAPLSKQKVRQTIEVEQREQGLSTALSSDNKGFQLLKKMGYKEGSKLGVNASGGLIEPIPIHVHQSRSGLGEVNEKKEKLRQREEVKTKFHQQVQSTYQDHLKQKYYYNRLRSDLRKCQAVCERLDREKFQLEENILWKSKPEEQKTLLVNEEQEEEEDVDQDHMSTMESKLDQITCYLREKHFYCLWCGQTFDSFDELQDNCPGNERDLH